MDEQRLSRVPLFASLSGRDRRMLARSCDEVDLAAGQTLTEQGRLAWEFLVIEEGTADVLQGDRHIRTLGPGDVVGEIGLLAEDRERTATVVATSPLRAVVMTSSQFRAMLNDLPDVAEAITAILRRRVGEAP